MSAALFAGIYNELINRGLKSEEFLSSGTWINPGVEWVWVLLVAGGGSGAANDTGGNPSGGCGGEIVFRPVRVTGDVTVNIGAGGAGATATSVSNAAGNDGGDTTFGSLVTARGGPGGRTNGGDYTNFPEVTSFAGVMAKGGIPGTSSAESITGFGNGGTDSTTAAGGASWGDGTDGTSSIGTSTDSAAANSGGGTGAIENNGTTGTGGSGRCIVFWME